MIWRYQLIKVDYFSVLNFYFSNLTAIYQQFYYLKFYYILSFSVTDLMSAERISWESQTN